jgi:threonine dehydrogenase-like Zn-dependent dehydrogenase
MCGLAATACRFASVTLYARYEQQAAAASRVGLARVSLDPPANEQRVPLVVDSVATGESLRQAMQLVEPFGRIVVVGCMTAPAELSLSALYGKEAELTGSTTYSTSREGRRHFDVAIEWMRSGLVDPTPMITHRFGLDEAAEAFRVATDKRSGAVKVVFERPGN